MIRSIHPLHRLTFILIFIGASVTSLCYMLSFIPEPVERISVRCAVDPHSRWAQEVSIEDDGSGESQGKRVQWTGQHSAEPHLVWRVLSWDVGGVRTAESEGSLEAPRRDARLITATLDASYQHPTAVLPRSTTLAPLVIMLQGAKPETQRMLEGYMRSRGGCWASAPLWETPQWVRWFSDRGVNLYAALWGSDRVRARDLQDRSLWVGVLGLNSTSRLRAERWSLPQIAGRWPLRWFAQRPAALMFEVNDHGESSRFVNIKLPDAIHKHQGGALAFRELQRPALKSRLGERWLISGDWRVTPPDTPPHPEVQFRFQRFSIAALYEGRFGAQLYPPKGAEAQIQGRWRLHPQRDSERTRAIIDYALSSQGVISGLPSSRAQLPWVGEREQRAPLWVKWSL